MGCLFPVKKPETRPRTFSNDATHEPVAGSNRNLHKEVLPMAFPHNSFHAMPSEKRSVAMDKLERYHIASQMLATGKEGVVKHGKLLIQYRS